ncbi:16S rRNA (adenine(1518)-N(6)/adenine(1519)-N(6))-dimethyltransferase [Chloroflexus islandicus]|uniref:Ribosomal RNA small subunit methyltransferase A n=1 Tax=Chloroflexus islandicus TaxID=1707952 RepID=A0A178MDB6_9CHLR|nr:16S rRNA (adenine(1518)-N(6)/adenine(1519)-N(6))-dimethyltransferase RsmA [Chloroflexus islandicus]OAN46028.1 16S rRNA (adenine(1518)-N(6)/adenine(1519)-N(6))-dimethyltransferase [Chloroflexus islandicus]
MNPYLNPQRIRAALRALNLRPTRGMGQNFLLDGHVLATIVAEAALTSSDTVIEVGPGLGVLTWELLARAGRVISVELDRRLAERLAAEFRDRTNLALVQGDVLELAPADLLARAGAAPPYKLVANIPYAITAPLLRHFLEAPVPPELSVLLVQWEVAQRICAGPGDYSVLAHAIQFYAEPAIVARVPASSFFPAPAVDSAIVRLQRRAQPAVTVADVNALFRLIKAGFLHARKQLGNALPSGLAALGVTIPREQVVAALRAAGIDPQRRAETVTLAEWANLLAVLPESGV